ncbi:MAG: beta-glucosidase [Caulobacteraceae bacterium]|nr:beta-glucosidase [Caulobacter sp.]
MPTRRTFGQAALGAGGLLAARPALAATPTPRAFPQGFKWGCATASYQIEGAVHEDGRGSTLWDTFSHTPGKIVNNANGDVACNSYHLYKTDAQLLKNMGVSTYRMSIAWSRIFPEGRGQPNAKGLDYYNRVIDNLLAQGITPYVTMFHWDLPSALPGEWQNRDTAYAFGDYAGYMAGKLSDRVRNFFTVNELRCFTDIGHIEGRHAPGLKMAQGPANQVRHHGVLAHGLGVQAIRAHGRPGTQVGLADNTNIYIPAIEDAAHIKAAQTATREENAMFLTAILEGRYTDRYLKTQGADAPKVREGDMKIIGSPLDFVGINCYTGSHVRPAAQLGEGDSNADYVILPTLAHSPRMISPWLYVKPESLYWGVRNTAELWNPKAMYITENGCSADDAVLPGGHVDDGDRIEYLRSYLTELQRATSDGYPVKGYFLWSLMDNFEWADGYTNPFGVHHVNYATQERNPKLSALWYRELIARNALV